MQTKKPLGFAVIGCGRIAPNHGQAIAALEDAVLVAAADVIKERAVVYTDRFGGEPYMSYKEMLERPDIDVVCICTPSGMHAEIGIAAAKSGKHVLVEKPMALSLRDADALIAACNEYGVKLGVVHQNRFNPVIVRLRQALEAGRFGQLNMGTAVLRWNRDQNYYAQAPWRGTWAQDGGCLMNQTIHCIDLLQWMMGPAESVYANTATRMREIEAEDNAAAVLRFKNGALGMIESSVTIYPMNLEETLNIFGATGSVVIGGVAVNRIEAWRFADGTDSEESILTEQQADPASVYGHGHRPLIADFIEAIRDGREPAVAGPEGRKALEIILGIYKSTRTGQPVRFPFVED
ncbi:MAG TPA: Gfo/Idh/MocA family oxidoreductase [Symbiobacteriaceae bacterium]|nr:Gfo/Idh/MocA family oxidoreductase [Symbiobacteriaceae bacterium]